MKEYAVIAPDGSILYFDKEEDALKELSRWKNGYMYKKIIAKEGKDYKKTIEINI